MKVEHRLTVVGTCPVDGSTDVYATTVTTSRVIAVEDILAAARNATEMPAYQEGITAGIRAELGRGPITVRTVGTHSGVETTCEVT